MSNIYSPSSLGVTPPAGGFQTGGWYSGRQYWNGTLSEPGVIHPESNQQGAGQTVSPQVNAASAAQQGVSPQQLETYLQQQRDQSAQVAPAASVTPTPQENVTPAATTGVETAGTGVGYTTQPTIDLQSLYNQAYQTAGIADLQTKYSEMQKALTEAKGKNNDNPFLSEASRVGREAKLQKLFDERTANILSDIAMKKADVETQMNLATKQYDINTQASKDALNQFNSLLSAGALNNASGQDIANLTKATGLSSTMIQSAIKANKTKGAQTTSYSDGTNDYFVTVDNDGNIINKQVIGKTAPTAAQRNATTGTAGTTGTKSGDKAANIENVKISASSGTTLQQIYMAYKGVLTASEIQAAYDATSTWGKSDETLAQIVAWGNQ
jgi:hypothetical protein